MTSRLALIVLLAGTSTLAACGTQGELERPAPLFGERARAEYAREQAAKEQRTADGNAQPNASGEDNAGDDTDVVAPPAYDDTNTPLPPRTAPITGQSPDPFRGSTGGALPDPYNNPNRSQ
jgi:predicted small lipoprotein YifL